MKRTLLKAVVIALVSLPLLLSSCTGTKREPAPSVTPAKSIVLGFAQVGAESAWRTANTRSIQESAANAGIQLMFTDAQQKQENQIKALRSYIAYRVDVIAFSPKVETGWDNVLAEAKAAGIPVILIDRTIQTEDESLYVAYMGSDFHEEGRRAGRWLLNRVRNESDSVNIVELSGTLDSSPMRGRAQGFREIITTNPKLNIIHSESGDFLRSKGREIMEQILKKFDDIDVIYSHNDSMTLGALSAMEEAGIKPGKDILIITVDAQQEAIDALKDGRINCVVECSPMLGPQLMQMAKDLVDGKTIPRATYTQERVFAEEDDLTNISPRGY